MQHCICEIGLYCCKYEYTFSLLLLLSDSPLNEYTTTIFCLQFLVIMNKTATGILVHVPLWMFAAVFIGDVF